MNQFSSSLPIWYQLTQILRTEILSGTRRHGDRLDPEVRMAQSYGISVVPVRQALRVLEQEGLVARRRGSGTYVSQPEHLSRETMTSLEALYSREFSKPAEIFERGVTDVPPQFARYFPASAQLAFVRRLAFRDERPWSYGKLYFADAHLDRLTADRLARYPLYRLLQEQYGISLVRSHFEVKAIAVDAEAASLLALEPFSPALSLTSIGFDKDGTAVGAYEMTFPSAPMVIQFETSHDSA